MEANLICPKCRAEIPLADVNVATDIALCRQCEKNWSYSELIGDSRLPRVDLQNPPHGAWFHETFPNAFEVGISTRSAAAFVLVPFMCAWSGLSLGGIYGKQFYQHRFDLPESLFGVPFILGTLIMGGLVVMSIFGKITVRVNGDDGVIFWGIGPVGWRRRFNWRDVTGIRLTESNSRRSSVYQQITIDGKKTLNFGIGSNNQRLNFMLAALRRKLRESGR